MLPSPLSALAPPSNQRCVELGAARLLGRSAEKLPQAHAGPAVGPTRGGGSQRYQSWTLAGKTWTDTGGAMCHARRLVMPEVRCAANPGLGILRYQIEVCPDTLPRLMCHMPLANLPGLHCIGTHRIFEGSCMRGGEVPNAPRMGEFYVMSQDYNKPCHGVELVNARVLRPAGRAIIRPEVGGFPRFDEVPRLRETSPDMALRDFQVGFEGYWLVSDRLKGIFESIDPDAFEFAECELVKRDGTLGDPYFLCDVVRSLDAIDDAASDVKVATEGYPKGKFYKLAGGAKLAFRKAVVNGAHVFGNPFNSRLVVCDRLMRDALVDRKFGTVGEGGGLILADAADY